MDIENDRAFQVMENAVKKFGENFVNYVMNKTLYEIKSVIDGKMVSSDSIMLRNKLNNFSLEQKQTLMEFIDKTVRSCMFNTMLMINEDDDIHLLVHIHGENKEIKEISDGLEGDLWYWIDWWGKIDN